MVFEIDGVNMLPYIAYGGLQWQRSDIDGENGGRTLDGNMTRDRLAIKIRWDVTCRPLKSSEISKVLTAIEPEYITLRYTNPVLNTESVAQFYSNNIPASFCMKDRTGTEWWQGLTFPVIQV